MITINIFKRFLVILSVIFLLISCQKNETLKPERLIPQTVVEDLSLPSISINGTLLHSEAFGDPSDPVINKILRSSGFIVKSVGLVKYKKFLF